jgi:hypothetical protein
LGKATLLTPVYISVAWTLMTSYQLFTETTVKTVTASINAVLPVVGDWMFARIDLIVFIHSFAWIFLLSSFIPAVLLGKQRGVLVQFGVCLTLAVLANVIQSAVTGIGQGPLDQIIGLAFLFQNPVIAVVYMSLPYLLMVWFDLRGKRKKDELMNLKMETNDYPEDVFIIQDDNTKEEKTQEEQQQYSD